MSVSVSEMQKLWDKALIKIEERLGEKQIFDSFFSGTYINEIYSDTIEVVVNSPLAVNLITSKYYDVIADIVSEITQSNYKLVFLLESDIAKAKEETKTYKPVSYFKDAYLNSDLTFESFVVGPFNREASQASVLVASNPGKMFNPLFIYSNSGLGKTHLMHSIGNYISKVSKPGSKVLCINANDFIEEFVKYAKGERDTESLKDYICGFDALLIDDIQLLANKTLTQEMFFTVFEKFHNCGKQIIITSDRQPSEIKDVEDRLITRFSQGLTVKINEPDQNTCFEILKKKITSSGYDLSRFDDSVLYLYADKFSRNIRELEGALNKLFCRIIQMQQSDKITMDIALEAAESFTGSKALSSQLNEQKVINIVADYYNLAPSQLTGKIRTGQIALARHIAMYMIRNTLDVPLKKIGDMFGGKDHTTVMSGIMKVDSLLKTDEQVKAAINELKKRIKG